MRTVIIGVGNPVRGDDGVGLRVARDLRDRGLGAEVAELCAGGLRLMEAMTGYDRAVVIDAVESGREAGCIHRLTPEDVSAARNLASSHDGDLAAALALGRKAGLRLPDDIRIWGVEAGDVETFSESLTPLVERAAAAVADAIARELHE